MATFISGLELSRRFYSEVIRPLLMAEFPALPYAAGLIGSGSEVLSFDSEMSTDHNWGPNVHIFVREEDERAIDEIYALLDARLPDTYLGYAIRFAPVPGEPQSLVPATRAVPGARHLIRPFRLKEYVHAFFGLELGSALDAADWLTLPSQKLRAFTTGAVFEDRVGELTRMRERLAWYPRDVWLYMLAAGWTRIAQEEHLMPRAGHAGDELGSALIGSRLVRDVMSLCFLMERQYAPYAKWFGSAFQQLQCAATLTPVLWRAQQAATWQDRMAALADVYGQLAQLHNGLRITPPLSPEPVPFHERPFVVIGGDRFAEAIAAQVTDPDIRMLAASRLIGNIDQFSDSTDLREAAHYREFLRGLYRQSSDD